MDSLGPTVLLLAALLAIPSLAPTAGAHAGEAIELEAREAEACLNTEVCLELASLPPDLAPGHATSLELHVHANASRAYTAALTTADEADTGGRDTPEEAAIATTPSVQPGESASANLTVPDASQLYMWLPGDDHEAKGGHERVPVGTQADGRETADGRSAHAGGLAAILAATLAAIGLRRRGTR